jgi:membrane protein YqaA with SNARE-associated domain
MASFAGLAAEAVAFTVACMTDLAVYVGLFITALASGTILPMQSEAALVALLLAGVQPPWLLITVASLGNVLGSMVNWLLGRGIERFRDRAWFPAKQDRLARAQRWYQRYGKWSLLLTAAPIVGDPLTVIAGVLREPLPVFLLLVSISKVGRYLILAAVNLNS